MTRNRRTAEPQIPRPTPTGPGGREGHPGRPAVPPLTVGEHWTECSGGDPTSDRPDTDALIAALYHDHARSLVGLARLFVDHRDAAEDIVQEAFIRLARSLHRIDDPTKAVAYLRSVVLNLARDHNRRGLLSLRHRPAANDLDPTGVEETITNNHDHQQVLNALRQLPRRQRDCLALHYLLELTVTEIADTLGLSPNSIKTHLKRGLAALRTQPELTALIGEDS